MSSGSSCRSVAKSCKYMSHEAACCAERLESGIPDQPCGPVLSCAAVSQGLDFKEANFRNFRGSGAFGDAGCYFLYYIIYIYIHYIYEQK